jgi:hypothetical protein
MPSHWVYFKDPCHRPEKSTGLPEGEDDGSEGEPPHAAATDRMTARTTRLI